MTHSLYVDQWDWERVITAEDRNVEFLKEIVTPVSYTHLRKKPSGVGTYTHRSWDYKIKMHLLLGIQSDKFQFFSGFFT